MIKSIKKKRKKNLHLDPISQVRGETRGGEEDNELNGAAKEKVLKKKWESVSDWGQVTVVGKTFTMTPVSPITESHFLFAAAAVSVAVNWGLPAEVCWLHTGTC